MLTPCAIRLEIVWEPAIREVAYKLAVDMLEMFAVDIFAVVIEPLRAFNVPTFPVSEDVISAVIAAEEMLEIFADERFATARPVIVSTRSAPVFMATEDTRPLVLMFRALIVSA